MSGFAEYACVFGAGGVGYGGLELLWRGRTHWTMLVTGGVCAVLLYRLADSARRPGRLECLAGGGLITAAEFAVGCVVNRLLGWNVWDYSGERGNLLGQICPRYAALWVLLSAAALPLCRRLRARLRGGSASR